jgi:hypothetical protein
VRVATWINAIYTLRSVERARFRLRYYRWRLGGRLPVTYTTLSPTAKAEIISDWEGAGRPIPPADPVKQALVLELAEKYHLDILVETGTYLGELVEATRGTFARIYTIEIDSKLHRLAMRRFRTAENVTVILGDSSVALAAVVKQIERPALFWLDAHDSRGITGHGSLESSLKAELAHLFSSWRDGNVILLDDVRDFARPGYPDLAATRKLIESTLPGYTFSVKDDIARICPERPG